MKKELFAYLTLLGLLIGSAISILYLNKIVETMTTHVHAAEEACIQGNYALAEDELSSALQLWINIDEYSHIFIRHAEIDTATDAYYSALSAIQQKEISALADLQMVQYHISSILSMEKPSFKSIL